MTRKMTIAVLVTCYNRVAVTLAGIGSLKAALAGLDDVDARFFVVDDASPDGTAAALRAHFPDLDVQLGTGDLFWVGGMHRAYQQARAAGSFDAYLLFNDDVVVDAGAVPRIFEEYRELNRRGPAILAAATRSPVDGSVSYSAMRRGSRLRPLKVEKIPPDGRIQPCDTFNGNFLLVPGPFFERIGGLDPRYVQAYADIDLGYVAEAAGIGRYLASIPVGACELNVSADAPARGWAGPFARLAASWTKQDSIGQRVHFIRKHVPLPLALPLAAITAVRMALGRALPRLTRS